MEQDMLNNALLLDTYGELLTEKMRLCCDLRYNQDLSLGEISELEGISRQAVRDNLARAEAQMKELEDKLGLVRLSLRLEAALEQLHLAADAVRAGSGAKEPAIDHINNAIRQIEEGTHGI